MTQTTPRSCTSGARRWRLDRASAAAGAPRIDLDIKRCGHRTPKQIQQQNYAQRLSVLGVNRTSTPARAMFGRISRRLVFGMRLIFGNADSLWRGRGGPLLLEVGATLGIRLRSWIAIGLASRVVDLGKRFLVFPLLLHCLTCRRVRLAIAARNGIQALDGMAGAATENK
jgi:hypothetical protein